MATVRTRKRGKTYSYVFEAGKTAKGRRKVVEKGGFKTEAEAYDAGVEAYNSFKHGNIAITSQKALLVDFLHSWLDTVHKQNVSENTYKSDVNNSKRHIEPFFENKALQDIKPLDIDNWLKSLLASGLSKNSIKNYKNTLQGCLQYAVFPAQLITSNPCIGIKVPKNAPEHLVKRSVISPEQYRELLTKAPLGHMAHIPVILAYNTGMRIGEILGLTWDNVDLKKRIISVQKQLRRDADSSQCHYLKPKNDSSRDVPITHELADYLVRWRSIQQQNEVQYGDAYVCAFVDTETYKVYITSRAFAPEGTERLNLVCTRKNGRVPNYASVSDFLSKNGLNAHSFRHTHITMLLGGGAPLKGVSSRVGHKDATTTLNVYTHATKAMDEDTLAVFEKLTSTKSATNEATTPTKEPI